MEAAQALAQEPLASTCLEQCRLCADAVRPSAPSAARLLFRPCACTTPTHLSCALVNYTPEQTCFVCNQQYFSSKIETDHLTDQISICVRDAIEALPSCVLCGKKIFLDGQAGTCNDYEFLRPCLCDAFCHQGCVLALMTRKERCNVCSYRYKHKTHGGFYDFLLHKTCVLSFPSFTYVIIFVCSVYVVVKSFTRVADSQLGIFVLLLLLLASAAFTHWVMCIARDKWDRFRERYLRLEVQECRENRYRSENDHTSGYSPYQLGRLCRPRTNETTVDLPVDEFDPALNDQNLSQISSPIQPAQPSQNK